MRIFFICSKHFISSDYTYGLKRRLKNDAVPSIKERSVEITACVDNVSLICVNIDTHFKKTLVKS